MEQGSQYFDVLKKYDIKLNDSDIIKKVTKIIEERFAENNNKEVYKKIYSCIDLTTLNATDTREDIWKFTERVNEFDGSSDMENVAAICVYPNLVAVAREGLTADKVRIVSVAGGFPSSQTFTEIKVAEAALAIASGADEIDIVISLSHFSEENYQEMCEEISEIKDTCRDTQLKVILETGVLKTASKIKIASILSLYSGADFLKTSTGKEYEGANLEAAYVMCCAIKEYETITGRKAGFKASGGIINTDDAVKYYTIVKELLGEEYTTNEYFRIGASRLATNLLESIK